MKFNRIASIGIIFFAVFSNACSFHYSTGSGLSSGSTKDKDASINAIAKFNDQLNAKQYAEICTETANKFKQMSSEDDCLKLFDAIGRKLGLRKNGTLQQWNSKTTDEGTFVTLVYNTEFEMDKGVEEFVYQTDGDTAKLAGYHVNSNAFLK